MSCFWAFYILLGDDLINSFPWPLHDPIILSKSTYDLTICALLVVYLNENIENKIYPLIILARSLSYVSAGKLSTENS